MQTRNEGFKVDFNKFKTEVSKRRRTAATRELTKIAYSAPQNIVSLAEGMPNEETFPFTEMAIKLNDGAEIILEGAELGAALQYLPSQGYPPLLKALREFQKKSHSPPLWESRDVIIVAGGQDGVSKTLEAVIGPGDAVLVQDPYYPGAEIVLSPHKAEIIPVSQDNQGVDPQRLRKILQERKLAGKKMPKIMYLNVTGVNPIGCVMPLERRKEIYKLACKYDFLILDDDPYHFMYFSKEPPKSFLSMDTEGRVIRIDSFSKVLSSGLRIGVITAPSPMIATIELHLMSSHLHAPTLSQVILYKLIRTWGYDRLMDHFQRIRDFYKERCDVISDLAEKHLTGLADFTRPAAGFFLWVKVRGIQDTWKMVMQRGIIHGVLVAPGAAFMADPTKPCNAIRLSFAKASYEEMNLALERLAQLIKDERASNYLTNGNT